jgi:hypothetical protein
MNHPNPIGWQIAQKIGRIEAEVRRIREEVVQVEQEIGAGVCGDAAKPFRLAPITGWWIEQRRDILGRRCRADRLSRALDVPGEPFQRLL